MTAADAVPAILPHEPIALEGLDHRLIHDQQIKGLNADALGELPRGQRLPDGAVRRRHPARGRRSGPSACSTRSARREHDPDVAFLDDPRREDELWQVREAGLGATAHVPDEPDTWEGWEDSAVHPERLGDYLRDLEKLYEEFGYADDSAPSLYGHFGQGCVHTRIPFGLTDADGVATYRRFLEQRRRPGRRPTAARCPGEHGDGQTRGELLPRMFGDTIMRAFGELKAIFDPRRPDEPRQDRRAGPRSTSTCGSAVDGRRASTRPPALRLSRRRRLVRPSRDPLCRRRQVPSALAHDGGAVMCPSYQATQEEEHSTRGRARLLFEMLARTPRLTDAGRLALDRGADALDLCLACKGCKSDCPVDVDMATYKAEFLSHHYEGRLRPARALRAGLAARCWPRLVHAQPRWPASSTRCARAPLLPRLATRAAGLAEPRDPAVRRRDAAAVVAAARRLQARAARHRAALAGHLHQQLPPAHRQAAVGLLEDAGWTVTIPHRPDVLRADLDLDRSARRAPSGCCAAPSTHSPTTSAPAASSSGLEPSCTAVFRSDAPDLFPDDLDVARLRDQHRHARRTAHRAHRRAGQPPRPAGRARQSARCTATITPRSTTGGPTSSCSSAPTPRSTGSTRAAAAWPATSASRRATSTSAETCAESVLLPSLRDADPDTVVLADGFSCRTQIHELDSGGREAVHLAELLDRARRGPASRPARRPGDDGRPAAAAPGASSRAYGALTRSRRAVALRADSRPIARRRSAHDAADRASSASPPPPTRSRRRSPRPTARWTWQARRPPSPSRSRPTASTGLGWTYSSPAAAARRATTTSPSCRPATATPSTSTAAGPRCTAPVATSARKGLVHAGASAPSTSPGGI